MIAALPSDQSTVKIQFTF